MNDYYAFLWEGFITLPTAGQYTFETVSDDGSKLYFNTLYNAGAIALVNNDGLHPATSASGSVTMAAGTYPIAIGFFQGTNSGSMQVYWSGPGITRRLIPDSAFRLTASGPENIVMSQHPNSTLQTATSTAHFIIDRIYPDPFNESFTVTFYNAVSTDNINIEIFDLNGRKVFINHVGPFASGNNSVKVNLNAVNIKDGVYILQIQKNGIACKTMKIIKMKK